MRNETSWHYHAARLGGTDLVDPSKQSAEVFTASRMVTNTLIANENPSYIPTWSTLLSWKWGQGYTAQQWIGWDAVLVFIAPFLHPSHKRCSVLQCMAEPQNHPLSQLTSSSRSRRWTPYTEHWTFTTLNSYLFVKNYFAYSKKK